MLITEADKKVYGCAGPPSPDSDDGIDDDSVLSNITYAPRDTSQIFIGMNLDVEYQ